ncbi:MAG: aminotransferase class III-fold pyridoxal phosphate-dependent enzyme, partial [Gammaproteobacteria bacterium]
MADTELYKNYCKPKLAELLGALKLDKNYQAASGNYMCSDDGDFVLDLIGGFGSTIVGHNHPEIVDTAVNALKNNVAVNAQGSLRNDSALLARRLSELTGHADGYYVNFSNSGAESIEAAIKHAYKVHFDKVRREYERLTRILNDFYYKVENQQLEVELPGKNNDLIDFRDDLDEYNLAQFEAFQNNPVLIAFKGSFHGKTMSALKVTFNKSYREAFEGLSAIKPVYIDPDHPWRIPEVVEENQSTFYYPVLNGNTVELRPFNITRVIGLMFEIVLGEGGIRPLAEDTLAQLAAMHGTLKVPYIIDEIQTGCGRVGNVYAYKDTPLNDIQPDYITLSKSLGGGIAKIGATLIKKEIYDQDFGILHTSTFAEDSLSSAIANKLLDILTRDSGKVLNDVKQKGDYLKQQLTTLKEKYPGIIKDVRGKGLMLGVEFTALQDRSPFFRASGKQGVLSLLIASYLLKHYKIRLLAPLTTVLKGNPGKKRQSILRIQPPATVEEGEMELLIQAIDEVLTIIERNNEYCLVAHLLGYDVDEQERIDPRAFAVRWPVADEQRHIDARVGFIVHPTTLKNLVDYYFPSFEAYPWQQQEMLRWWNAISRFLEPVHVKSTYVASNDFVLENNMVFVPYLPHYINAVNTIKQPFLLREMQDKVQDAVTVAKELGDDNIPVSIVGLGAYTSIITQN